MCRPPACVGVALIVPAVHTAGMSSAGLRPEVIASVAALAESAETKLDEGTFKFSSFRRFQLIHKLDRGVELLL